MHTHCSSSRAASLSADSIIQFSGEYVFAKNSPSTGTWNISARMACRLLLGLRYPPFSGSVIHD